MATDETSANIGEQISELQKRITELEGGLESKAVELEYVATTGLMITSLLDIDQVLSAMMDMAIRTVSGEVGCILLNREKGLEAAVSWGLDRQVVDSIQMRDGSGIVSWVQAHGQPAVINQPSSVEKRSERVNSAIAVPLMAHDRQIGVLIIVNRVDGGEFTDSNLKMLETLVRFAAVAIENAKLLAQELQQQRLQHELELAKQVQQALLPERVAQLPHARIEAIYQPAGKIGGDYFDLIPLCEGEFVVIVGDVSSKGVPAALLMTAVRSLFRMETMRGIDVVELIGRLNSFLCEQVFTPNSMFVTLVYVYFNLGEGTCTYCNAGHLPPLHLSETGLTRWKSSGTALGLFSDSEFGAETVSLSAGDRILFYTDGVTEACDSQGDLYGTARLQEKFIARKALPASDQLAAMLKDVRSFQLRAEDPNLDDLTILMVELE